MEYKDIKPLIDSIPDFGWMGSERQREYMFNLGKVTTCAAEIGTYKGLSAAIVGLGMSDGEIKYPDYYCIDTFQSSNVELDGKDTFFSFVDNIRSMAIHSKRDMCVFEPGESKHSAIFFIAVKGFSYDVVNELPDELDWIYIDGSHETKDVLQDIELYAPKVKDGGLLLFHDHTWDKEPFNVRGAIDIAVSKNIIKLVEYFDDFGIYQKV